MYCIKRTTILIGIILALALAFTGCPQSDPESDCGTGTVSLTIGSLGTSRAIQPITVLQDFTAITARFTKGGQTVDADVIGVGANSVTATATLIVGGPWTLTVNAFLPGNILAAQYIRTDINIVLGPNPLGNVTLRSIQEGTGTFSWGINFPMSIVTGGTIEVMDEPGGSVLRTVPLPVPIASSWTSSLLLGAGDYFVVVTLRAGARVAYFSEDLHIYHNMASHLDFNFVDGHFMTCNLTCHKCGNLFPCNCPRTLEESVQRVIFTADTATVTFSNLSGNNIYLFRVNTSGNTVGAGDIGSVLNVSPNLTQSTIHLLGSQPVVSDTELPPRGHPAAREFNANPPLIKRDRSAMPAPLTAFVPPVVGDIRYFWVETFLSSGSWIEVPAVLLATGTHGNIWVVNNGITVAQAQRLSNQFDILYPVTTNILGFEYGGGPSGHGGMDGDPKVQILVYDILDAAGNVAAGGFFWSKDWFTQAELDAWGLNMRTNLAEIFYIDSSQVRNVPDWIPILLAHELQHLINWNVKSVQYGANSATWYNEMLAMMMEDLIACFFGIPPTNWLHSIMTQMPLFLNTYNEVGFTEWGIGLPTAVRSSYAKAFAFGAFLMRNFGGAELLKSIHANNTTNVASITAALQKHNGTDVDFLYALRRFGEAMVFSGASIPAGALTFDRTITNTINGITYTSHAFDIWNMTRSGGGLGPQIFGLVPMAMRPHSVLLQSSDAWRNRSGDISITLQRPSNSGIELYLLVR